jgi:hypothetical protein
MPTPNKPTRTSRQDRLTRMRAQLWDLKDKRQRHTKWKTTTKQPQSARPQSAPAHQTRTKRPNPYKVVARSLVATYRSSQLFLSRAQHKRASPLQKEKAWRSDPHIHTDCYGIMIKNPRQPRKKPKKPSPYVIRTMSSKNVEPATGSGSDTSSNTSSPRSSSLSVNTI